MHLPSRAMGPASREYRCPTTGDRRFIVPGKVSGRSFVHTLGQGMSTVPDSRTARAARALVSAACEPWLSAHVWRTWLFGSELIERRGLPAPDWELAFVAAMCHDLGLTTSYASAQPFEESGALAAEAFGRTHGWTAERIGLLGEAVRCHLDLASAGAEPEVALVHLGAAADVVGLGLEHIPDEVIEEVLVGHPREDFAARLQWCMDREALTKPTSKLGRLYSELGFGVLIGLHPLDGP